MGGGGGTQKRIIPLFCSCTHVIHATRGSFSTIPYYLPIGGNLLFFYFSFSGGGRSLVEELWREGSLGRVELPLSVFFLAAH